MTNYRQQLKEIENPKGYRKTIKQKLQKVKKGCGNKFLKENIVNILTFGLANKPNENVVCKKDQLCPKCEKLEKDYIQTLINKRRIMKCKKCGGTSFSFRWDYDEDDEMNSYMCHDGMGFQLTDSIIRCDKCKKESPYEQEEFITTEVFDIKLKEEKKLK